MTDRHFVQYAQTTKFESRPIGYFDIYEKYFSPLMDNEIKLLALGVATGQSMRMWSDYFVNGSIIGVNLFLQLLNRRTGILKSGSFKGRRQIPHSWIKLPRSRSVPQNGFDIIVDDYSHIGELTKISFWHLFSHHLKKGGIYALEDWGTGYWGRHVFYPDGEFFDSADQKAFYIGWRTKC